VVGALFRIQGQPVDVELRHPIAEVTLDERLGHEGREVQEQESLDAQVALEQDGPHPEDGLELLVAFLERGLMFVGLESVLQGERFIVGDEGEDPIGTRFLEQCLGVGVPVQHGTLVAVADVGCAGTGTPPTGLGEALLLQERDFDMKEALDLLVSENLLCRGADLLETVQA
jgi:hypothetical protein